MPRPTTPYLGLKKSVPNDPCYSSGLAETWGPVMDENLDAIDTALSALSPVPPISVGINVVYVDGGRSDTYNQDGSSLFPYKTIQQAVNLIAQDGNNSIEHIYRIIVGPAVYPETIELSDPRLVCLVFTGWGATVGGPGFSGPVLSIQDNDNLSDVMFIQMNFRTGGTSFLSIGSKTNNTGLASGQFNSYGIAFYDCSFNGGGAASIGQCANFLLDRCSFPATTPAFTFTNVNVALVRESQMSQGASIALVTDTTQPVPNGFSGTTQLSMRHCTIKATVTIDARSQFVLADGARQIGAVTVNGLFRNFNSSVTAPITVNSGGTYRAEAGGVHNSTLTVNPGGTVQAQGVYIAGGVTLGAAAPPAQAGQVGFGAAKATTASAGTGQAPPATVDSYLIINDGGVIKKIALFAN